MEFLNGGRWQRLGLSVLRRWFPVLRLGNLVVVTRREGVEEVLGSDGFSVVPLYAERMRRTSGEFYLGMDDGPRYRREKAITQRALAQTEPHRLEAMVRRLAKQAIDERAASGELDVVRDLALRVPLRVCAEFFGVPGPDPNTLGRWTRSIFQHLFLNLGNEPELASRAEKYGEEMREYLGRLLAARKSEVQAGVERHDFLSELVRLQQEPEMALDDAGIVRNAMGVVLGSVDTISKLVAHALEELLRRPEAFADATAAARAGDVELVARHAFEALRFNPHSPVILRETRGGASLRRARGQVWELPAGRRVLAVIYSAMFDPSHVVEPEAYRTDRGDLSHIQFGFGLHRCLGEQLALCEVPQILTALLALEGLARARGAEGKTVWEGAFPTRLRVTFHPVRDVVEAVPSSGLRAAAFRLCEQITPRGTTRGRRSFAAR